MSLHDYPDKKIMTDHKTEGEFHVDLYTLPDNLIKMLWDFTQEKGALWDNGWTKACKNRIATGCLIDCMAGLANYFFFLIPWYILHALMQQHCLLV